MAKEKPALYWAIVRDSFLRAKIVAVTTEKGSQVFGRGEDGLGTHCRKLDVLCKFPTEEAARGRLADARRIRERYAEARKPLELASRQLYADEEHELKELWRS